jgi:hypothetical protein
MIHIPPSWFVRTTCRYLSWCSITHCPDCGLRAKYEDCHPVDPCPSCGGKLQVAVGHWKVTVKPIFLFRKERGEWVMK